jgi:hypothetical protein
MGIIIPTIIFGLLFAVPYIDRNPSRSMYKRPVALALGMLAALGLIVLSYMGLPQYGIETPAATRIIQDIAPEEGEGPLHEVPYEELVLGVYTVSEDIPRELCPDLTYVDERDRIIVGCPHLTAVFAEYSERVIEAATNEDLPDNERLPNAEAVMVIQDWQPELRKVTLRITWDDVDTGETKSYERDIYLHHDRSAMMLIIAEEVI